MSFFKTESAAISWFQDQLKQVPGCYFQKIYLRFTSGFPDLVIGWHGHTAFYEIKLFRKDLEYSKQQLEPIQRATILRMRKSALNAGCLILKDHEEAWAVVPATLTKMNHAHLVGLPALIRNSPVGLLRDCLDY